MLSAHSAVIQVVSKYVHEISKHAQCQQMPKLRRKEVVPKGTERLAGSNES